MSAIRMAIMMCVHRRIEIDAHGILIDPRDPAYPAPSGPIFGGRGTAVSPPQSTRSHETVRSAPAASQA